MCVPMLPSATALCGVCELPDNLSVCVCVRECGGSKAYTSLRTGFTQTCKGQGGTTVWPVEQTERHM